MEEDLDMPAHFVMTGRQLRQLCALVPTKHHNNALCGLHFDFGIGRIVATNGKAMVAWVHAFDGSRICPAPSDQTVLVPRVLVMAAASIADKGEISVFMTKFVLESSTVPIVPMLDVYPSVHLTVPMFTTMQREGANFGHIHVDILASIAMLKDLAPLTHSSAHTVSCIQTVHGGPVVYVYGSPSGPYAAFVASPALIKIERQFAKGEAPVMFRDAWHEALERALDSECRHLRETAQQIARQRESGPWKPNDSALGQE